MTITLSVIVPTYGREEVLRRTVRYLGDCKKRFQASTSSTCEIIVIDQNIIRSNDLIEMCDFVYIHHPFPNLPNARNVGLDRARGDIILFLDDDIIPSPDLFINHVRLHMQWKRAGIIGGKVLGEFVPKCNSKRPGAWVDWCGRSRYNQISDVEVLGIRGVIGCNMSFKSQVFANLRFDTEFQGNALFEETDVCYHARKEGWLVGYSHVASIEHLVDPRGGTRTHQLNYEKVRLRNLVRFTRRNFPLILQFTSLFVQLIKVTMIQLGLWNFIRLTLSERLLHVKNRV